MTALRVPKDEARRKLELRLMEGRKIRDIQHERLRSGWLDLQYARNERSDWVEYTRDTLKILFVNPPKFESPDDSGFHHLSREEQFREFQESMDALLGSLESLLNKYGRDVGRAGLGSDGDGSIQSVFISHSSHDAHLINAVTHAFHELPLKPLFLEENPAGIPPVDKIAEKIEKSKAIFAFFTPNSIVGGTRDWIVFELGIAQVLHKQVFCWVQNQIKGEDLPKLLEQITTYNRFETQPEEGMLKLLREVRDAAKGLVGTLNRDN